MRSGVVPIRARSSICRTRKSAASARLITPNRQSFDLAELLVSRPGRTDGPVESRRPDDPLLDVLVVIDTLQEQGKDDGIVEETTMTAAVSGAETEMLFAHFKRILRLAGYHPDAQP
jgi:hypothetical protein